MFNEFLIRTFPTEDERMERGLTPELQHLHRFLGKPTLAEGAIAANMQRAVDVGVRDYFEQVKHLANLQCGNNLIFGPGNLWAIDRKISLIDSNRKLGSFTSRVNVYMLAAEQLQKKVADGEISPFDLVMATGVVSLLYLPSLLNGGYQVGLELIQTLKGCLNPENPEASLLLSSIGNSELVPCSDVDFGNMGLQVMYGNKVGSDDCVGWGKRFQRGGYFPPEPYDNFYDLVICRNRT